MELSEKQLEMCESSKWDFADLKALFINCTLKKSPEMSHTQGLIRISKAIMEMCCARLTMTLPMVFGPT